VEFPLKEKTVVFPEVTASGPWLAIKGPPELQAMRTM